MMFPAFFNHPLWSKLAAMHGHFLWQGLLIAWIYWSVLKIFAVRSARLRYLLGMTGLAAMAVSTLATFLVVEVSVKEEVANKKPVAKAAEPSPTPTEKTKTPGRGDYVSENDALKSPLTRTLSDEKDGDTVWNTVEIESSLPRTRPLESREKISSNDFQEPENPARPSNSPSQAGEVPQDSEEALAKADVTNKSVPRNPPKEPTFPASGSFQPWLLGGWLLGVLVSGMRLVAGFATVFWYRWTARPVGDLECQSRLEQLSHRVGFNRPPRLVTSSRAGEAFSFGLFKPVIVLPASWLLRLSPETLESVLAHELGHIRRWDAWATLFQRLLESALFYHPAVWWISRQVDREREKCCDLKAVSLTGDRLHYVKSLAGIAEFQRANRPARWSGPILATGIGGRKMYLLERVRNVLGETPRTGAASRFFAGALILAVPAALWIGTMMFPASADEGVLVAQTDEDREREGDRPRGDRDRENDREREGDRPRRDRERDRERREGDRPRGEREREGDRERGDRERGDRERDREREGDRELRDRERGNREGDRERGDRDRPRFGLNPFRGGPGRFGRFRRDEDRPNPQVEMLEAIRELSREVELLRREVQALRETRSGEGRGIERRDRERRELRDRPRREIREGEGREIDRPERAREDRERERDREEARPERERERDRPSPEERIERERERERPRAEERIEREREREREGDRDREREERDRERPEEEALKAGAAQAESSAKRGDREE